MTSTLATVVTTIRPPTESMRCFTAMLADYHSEMIVIGDRKGPTEYLLSHTRFYSFQDQLTLPFQLAPLLPSDHYARKNIGYLIAMQRGIECIYETDDDNSPESDWTPRKAMIKAQVASRCPWLNVYRLYCKELIWPRGYPLQFVLDHQTHDPEIKSELHTIHAPIQQGLVNDSPDVDALWRLTLNRQIQFSDGPSISLPPGTWCPFNSQNTWWWPDAFPLMYLPCHCSMRMTDIWRSFVAQRCLWAAGSNIAFHAPDVSQKRNPHNLMQDFAEEVPGYTRNAELTHLLDELDLVAGKDAIQQNLLTCYQRLVEAQFFPPEELPLVKAWLDDLQGIG